MGMFSEKLENENFRLRKALEWGGIGPSANILLWNAAGILKELAEKDGNLPHVVCMAAELKKKAQIEFEALKE